MNQYESPIIPPPSERQQCLLRRSLPGEYLSLALMLHAGFGSLVWGGVAVRAPACLLIVAAGLWTVSRAAGAFAQRGFTPLVTAGLLVAVLVLGQQNVGLPTLTLTIFSLPVFIAMLGATLLLDVLELVISPEAAAASRRLRGCNWHRIVLWALAAAFVIYMVVIPTAGWVAAQVHPPKSGRILETMSFAEQVRLRSMEAIAAFWFFALGSTIGSFLNVVVYRMPRGKSVVFQRSNCPRCGTLIKRRDNIPILGWLFLNGRCRACRAAISVRYPLVESITAAIFLLVYFVELISGGANVPVRQPNFYHGVVWIIFYTKWDLVALYLFHCFSLSTLLTWALIDIDRQRMSTDEPSENDSRAIRIPWRVRWGIGTVICVLPLLLPHLLPVPWMRSAALRFDAPEWLLGIGTGVVGGLVGALLGWFAARMASRQYYDEATDAEEPVETSCPPDGHTTSAGMIVGLSVGWQAAVGVWFLVFAMRPITYAIARRWNLSEPPLTTILLVAYLIHLIGWRWLTVRWWPSYTTTPIAWVFLLIGLGSLWLVNRSLPMWRWSVRDSDCDAETAVTPTGPLPSDSATS